MFLFGSEHTETMAGRYSGTPESTYALPLSAYMTTTATHCAIEAELKVASGMLSGPIRLTRRCRTPGPLIFASNRFPFVTLAGETPIYSNHIGLLVQQTIDSTAYRLVTGCQVQHAD